MTGSTPIGEPELRRELVRFSKWLSRLGFMPGTSGNSRPGLTRVDCWLRQRE